MNRIQAITAWVLLGLLSACGGSKSGEIADANSASSSGMAQITAIELNGADAETAVTIKGSQELKYNVFKLTDPDRVMVDLIDAKMDAAVASELKGNDIVSSIRAQSIEDSLSNLVRIEIELSRSGNYLASLDGTNLVVRVVPAGSPLPEEMKSQPVAEDALGAPMALAPSVELPPIADAPLPGSPELSPLESTSMDAPRTEEIPAPVMLPPVAEAQPIEPVAPPALDMPMEAVKPSLEEVKPEAVPMFVPPVAEERTQENKDEKPSEKTAKRIEVVPDGNVNDVDTQDIPTTMFTEGTSTLGAINSRVYTGSRVSLEFQDAQIQDIIRLIADVSKLNIIVADDVKGTLTLKLVDVPWDQALDIILTAKGLDKVQHGNILRVAPVEALKKERELALANDKAAKQLEPTKLKIFSVNYADATEMKDRIKNLLTERGKVDTDERTNSLIVEDIAENLSRAENLIRILDSQTPQVRIESRIVQANDRFVRSIGVQWGPTLRLDETNNPLGVQFPRTVNLGSSPGFAQPAASALSSFAVDALPGNSVTGGALGLRLGSVSDIFNLDLQLQYAENEQLGRIVSRPSITVLDNKKASIIQGSRIPFLSSSSEGSNVQFQEAGVEISVTPQITNDGAVILQVSARSNEPASENVGGNPIINIREAQTELLVKSARTAVLGGVFRTSDTRGEGGVPGLMHIPILGYLFKGHSRSTNREETLIFITPYILTDQRDPALAPDSTTKLEE